MVKINGAQFELNGTTIGDYIKQSHFDPKTIAVEINEEIVPKSLYDNTVLKDGDTVEIVNFVGGG